MRTPPVASAAWRQEPRPCWLSASLLLAASWPKVAAQAEPSHPCTGEAGTLGRMESRGFVSLQGVLSAEQGVLAADPATWAQAWPQPHLLCPCWEAMRGSS